MICNKVSKFPKFNFSFAGKVLRIFLLVIIAFLIGLTIFLINTKYYLRDSFPMIGGWGVSIITTGSMSPTYEGGDIVFVQEQDEYKEGDCVVYIDSMLNPVVHRLIKKLDNNEVVTKGDANNVADKTIDAKNIRGKVQSSISGAGIFFNDYTKAAALVLLVVLFVYSIRKEAKIRKSDKQRTDEIIEEINKLKKQNNINNTFTITDSQDKNNVPEVK